MKNLILEYISPENPEFIRNDAFDQKENVKYNNAREFPLLKKKAPKSQNYIRISILDQKPPKIKNRQKKLPCSKKN